LVEKTETSPNTLSPPGVPFWTALYTDGKGDAVQKDTGKKPASAVHTEPVNTDEAIRLRAYQLYEARGREDGRDLDDWLCAEDEITNKKTRTIAA
jgi:hypothetical protein